MEYKTIICPVDGSELSDIAEGHAAYLAKVSGAKLLLLHVVEKWYHATHLTTDSAEWQAIHEDWLKKGEELLQKEEAKLRERGITNISTVLRDGDASHEIIALAVEKRADLVIMASHRYSPVGKLFMGSVIDRVTKKSPCPVLWVFK
jgi:nucleotide-binding universal stress UspA family protein